MAGGLFQGLGKLLDTGAAYLQHQQFAERLRGMQLEDAKAQLTAYVRGMSAAGFSGLKLALTLVAKNTKDPATIKLLNGLLESLDAAREGRAPAASATGTASRLAETGPPRTFDEDLAMVAGWYNVDPSGPLAIVTAHLDALTPGGFRAFRANVSQMVDNVAEAIRQHEATEDQAWGRFAEDRMNYRLARLRTGQRDPGFLARLRELQGYGVFYQWVCTTSDVVWEQVEQQRRQAEHDAAQAAVQDEPAIPADAPIPAPTAAAPARGDEWRAGIEILRAQLHEDLASGEIRAERRASYERLLDRMESLVGPLSDPTTPIGEAAKLLDRFRGLMADFQQAYVSPGAADRLDGLSQGARARTLESCIADMKGFLYRELTQSPPRHTAERVGELIGDLTRAHQDVASLTGDDAAVGFEREMLRVTARGIHDFAQREHLMLVRPLWQCGEASSSPHAIFYAGEPDLAGTVHDLAARRRLDLLPLARGQYYGQARWDALRSSHVGVFDLRGYHPDLVRTDAPAAARLAATGYELGLACALGKPVVVVTQPHDILPFDVDIAPCEVSGLGPDVEQRLSDAFDRAWYGRQRTTGASCLQETHAFLDQITQDHPRRKMLEATGLLDARQVEDPIGFTGTVKQILREQGLGDLQAICPAWAGRYPDAAVPTMFHVMPFSPPWANDVRDAAHAACTTRGYAYRRGDEADEGRIIQAIWDDICAAHVVLVDLTGLNVNVLMELGMAHALGRTVLTVRQGGLKEPLPRNIEKLRVLDYDGAAGLSRLLGSRLAARTAAV